MARGPRVGHPCFKEIPPLKSIQNVPHFIKLILQNEFPTNKKFRNQCLLEDESKFFYCASPRPLVCVFVREKKDFLKKSFLTFLTVGR